MENTQYLKYKDRFKKVGAIQHYFKRVRVGCNNTVYFYKKFSN